MLEGVTIAQEAMYYEKMGEDKVLCSLCPKECVIKEGKRGFCRARENKEGILYARIYSQVSSYGIDPIEKKPLYHFHPGEPILSLGTIGCNFVCLFCQNWRISQLEVPTEEITPQEAVGLAKKYNLMGVSYTYSEPLIWYEYVLETAKLAKEEGLVNVLVTNGFINEKPLKELIPFIDGVNIDIKAFTNAFYKKMCKGELAPVLQSAEIVKKSDVHLEITNLIIPTLNDEEEETEKLVTWVTSSLGVDTPLHFSRYFPHYKLDIPPTPVDTLKRAREIALKKLRYVYIGNVTIEGADNTYCYNCKKPIIVRGGYKILKYEIQAGKCKFCGTKIDLVEKN